VWSFTRRQCLACFRQWSEWFQFEESTRNTELRATWPKTLTSNQHITEKQKAPIKWFSFCVYSTVYHEKSALFLSQLYIYLKHYKTKGGMIKSGKLGKITFSKKITGYSQKGPSSLFLFNRSLLPVKGNTWVKYALWYGNSHISPIWGSNKCPVGLFLSCTIPSATCGGPGWKDTTWRVFQIWKNYMGPGPKKLNEIKTL